MKHTAVISIGSNVDSKELVVTQALSILGDSVIRATRPYMDQVDNDFSFPYLNIVASIETSLDYETLRHEYKELERRAGRTPGSKLKGLIELDIDIVIFDNEIRRQEDYDSYHFRTGYQLLKAGLEPVP